MLASSQPLLVRQVQLRSLARAVVVGIAAYGVVAPLLAIAHELIVLGTAHLVGDVSWLVATGGVLRVLPLDPIFNSVPEHARDRMVARYDHEVTVPNWALGWRWDIVLEG